MLSLDVGCGIPCLGDVNCDLYVKDIGHRLDGSVIDIKGKNFVLCDALHLPFLSKSFSCVFCFHVIEHIRNPFLLMDELIRVCCGELVLRLPHWLSSGRSKWHVNKFNRSWFVERYFTTSTRIIQWRFPIPFCGLLRFPYEFEVVIKC